jgi:hypothetical protein
MLLHDASGWHALQIVLWKFNPDLHGWMIKVAKQWILQCHWFKNKAISRGKAWSKCCSPESNKLCRPGYN